MPRSPLAAMRRYELRERSQLLDDEVPGLPVCDLGRLLVDTLHAVPMKISGLTFDEAVRTRVVAAITRIVNAEAAASGAPKLPEITAS